jgi:putative CocE/NonD family hydrolase
MMTDNLGDHVPAAPMSGPQPSLVPGVAIESDALCVMRDGTILRADVYRPIEQQGDLPVLLLRIPYNKAVAQSVVYHHPAWYARQGYIVVVQDTRGRFSSDGDFDPLRTEAEDGFDAIEWAAGLPGSSGRVGTYGFSYAGATQLLAATQQPPALACCAPGFTSSDYYADWTYEGGALNLAFIVSWTVQLLAIPDALRRGRPDVAQAIARRVADFPALYAERPLNRFSLLDDTDVAPFFFDWLEHDTRDEYWQEISLEHRFDAIDVPCLHFGGWFDTFAVGTLRNFSELAARAKAAGSPETHRLVMGPWIHMPWGPVVGSCSFGPEAKNRLNEEQLRWFDKWLKDKPSDVERSPAQLFVMRANRWRTAEAWPPADSVDQEWFIHSDGRANSLSSTGTLSREAPGQQDPDIFVFDPGNPAPSAGGRSCCDPNASPMGVAPQRAIEVRNDVLLYTSDALRDAVEVTGDVRVLLHAATSAVDTDWVVRLCDVDEDGVAVNVCQGILRARFRDGLATPSLVAPGEVVEYEIRLGPTSWEFAAGHRLRLHITSSDYPAHDVNPNTGQRVGEVGLFDGIVATQVVHHDELRPTRLLLPVAGDRKH